MAANGADGDLARDDAKPRRKLAGTLGKFKIFADKQHCKRRVLDGVEMPPYSPIPNLPDRFVFINQVGKGAQSSVYAVFDRELNCKAALKFFSGGGEARGAREARVLSGVEHPNVVRVLDVQLTEEKRLYLRMEFIDGDTLGKWVVGRPWREVLGAYVQAGRGLAAAHKVGVVHRDFKPDNALVRKSDDKVVVIDFGVAREGGAAVEIDAPDAATSTVSQSFPLGKTRTGWMGTHAYMAPEQLVGKQELVDARSDQFGFCIALYEALDGQRPFLADSLAALVVAVTAGKIKGPPRNAPPWVWRVIRRGLSVDPEQRYPSMEALLADLEKDPRKWFARAGAAVVGLALVAGVWEFRQQENEQHAAERAHQRALTDIETSLKEMAEQVLADREDALTLREAKAVMNDDPTRALGLLAKLSPSSKYWRDPRVRTLAADADHRVVAKEVVDLGANEEPYGLSPDGTIAITRQPTSGEVSLHRLSDRTRDRMGVADTGLPVVAFSPDGRVLATQRVPQGIHRGDTTSDSEPTFLGESPDAHHHLLVFGGAGGIVTFGRDAEAIRWHEGARQVLGGHVAPIDAVVVDRAGRYAATFDGARQVRLWDLASERARTLPGVVGPIAFSPEGKLAVTGSGPCSELDDRPVTEVRIVDPTSGRAEILCTDSPLPLGSIAFSPNGERVAAALPGRVLVWDLGRGERVDLERPDGEASELRFATDDLLGSQSQDTTLVLWVLPSERPYVLHGHVGVAHWAHRDEETIVTFGREGGLRVWTLPPRFDRSLQSHEDTVTHVAFAGEELVTASKDGSVRAWPSDGGKDRLLSAGRGEIAAMAVTADGRRIALARNKGGVILVERHGAETTLAEREQVFGLAWDASGQRLAIADASGGVDIVDVEGRLQTSIREDDGFKVRDAHFHRDGSAITTAGWVEDSTISIRVFDAETGSKRLEQALDPSVSQEASQLSGVVAVAFSADDRSVAISTFHRTVLVWDADAGPRVLGKHDRQVPGADFSPDGTLLVTVDDEGVAKLWDVKTGFNRTIRFRRPLRAVAFGPDGRKFAAVGDARVAFFGRDDLPTDPDALRAWVAAATNLRVEQTELDWAAQ